MSAMPGMEMPGGWTMSMAWMRMPGQSWSGAAATFIGMWTVMMVAMMLPVLVPMLMRYREAIADRGATRFRLTALVAAGYFIVWVFAGMTVYPFGIALAAAEMRFAQIAQAVPIATGTVVLIAGILQFTPRKRRQLACCRAVPMRSLEANAVTAWRHGLRLGLDCVHCCAGPSAALLVVGVMDLRAMMVVAIGIAAERLVPAGEHAARAIGAVAITAGLWMIALAIAS